MWKSKIKFVFTLKIFLSVISQKESEFKSIIETLLEQNKIHRENSQVYDKNKDLIFSKWVTEMKKNHMIKIEEYILKINIIIL